MNPKRVRTCRDSVLPTKLAFPLLAFFTMVGCTRELPEVAQTDEIFEPLVSSFSPVAGIAGETLIRVEGSHFSEDAQIYFGSQPGIWDFSQTPEDPTTTLHALVPYGTPSQVYISVRGRNGEAQAEGIFLVLSGPPQIQTLSDEHVRGDATISAYGQNFNPYDNTVGIFLGEDQITEYQVSLDSIEINLGSTEVGTSQLTGWKYLRYIYPSGYDDELSETAAPIYIVRRPEILWQSSPPVSGGLLRVTAKNYDFYEGSFGSDSRQNNILKIGPYQAEILSARTIPDGSGKTSILARAPNIPTRTDYALTLENIAGIDEASEVVSVQQGVVPQYHDLYDCADRAVSGIFPWKFVRVDQSAGFFLAHYDADAGAGYSMTGYLVGTNGVDDFGFAYLASGFAAGLPWSAAPIMDSPSDDTIESVTFVTYDGGVDGTTQNLSIYWMDRPAATDSYTPTIVDSYVCPIATASAAVPDGADTSSIYAGATGSDAAEIEIFHVPADPHGLGTGNSNGRIVVTLHGGMWSGVYGLDAPSFPEDPDTGDQLMPEGCDGVDIESLTPLVDLEGINVLDMTVDPWGEWLTVLADDALYAVDLTRPPYTLGDPVPGMEQCDEAFGFALEDVLGEVTGEGGLTARLVPRSGGVAIVTSGRVCNVDIRHDFVGRTTGEVISYFTIPENTLVPCVKRNCPDIALTADEASIWLPMTDMLTHEYNTADALVRFDLMGGQILQAYTVSPTDRIAHLGRNHPTLGGISVLTVNDAIDTIQEAHTLGFTAVCNLH